MLLDTAPVIEVYKQTPPVSTEPVVRRVDRGDLGLYGPYLVQRIQAVKPWMTVQNIASLLNNYISDNSAFFARYRNCFMLAIETSAPFQQPWVEELFALQRAESQDEALDLVKLYGALREWARSRGHEHVRILRGLSDTDRTTLAANYNRTKKMEPVDTLYTADYRPS
jgi:hypothetical protein